MPVLPQAWTDDVKFRDVAAEVASELEERLADVARVLAVAVCVDAVAGEVERAGVNLRVAVVAVAAAESARVPVAVEIEQPPSGVQRVAGEGRPRAGDLA